MSYISANELGNETTTDTALSVNSLPAFNVPDRSIAPQAPAAPKPTGLETVTAAFRLYHSGTAIYDAISDPYRGSKEFDKDFSPRRKAVEEGLGEYADQFTSVANIEEYNHVKGRVLQRKQAQQTIDNAGGWGIAAALPAAIIDPPGMLMMAVPILGQARIANIASLPLRYATNAGAIAATGVATGAVQVGAMQALAPVSENETVGSLYSLDGDGTKIAMAAGLGLALLGTTGRAVSRATKEEVQKSLETMIRTPDGVLLNAATPAEKAAGTAINETASKLYENAGTKALATLADDVARGTLDGIGLKLAKSPFDVMRVWGQKLAPDIMQRIGTKEGIASPLLNAKLLTMMEGNSDIHAFGRTLLNTKQSLDSLKDLPPNVQQELLSQLNAIGIGAKTIDDITPSAVQRYTNELIGHSVATGQRHIIPEIDSAAQKLRSIFAKDWARIVKQGMDNVSDIPMPTYFTRVFNKEGIAQNQIEFIQRITPSIEESLLRNGVIAAEAAAQAEAVAVAVTNKITGAGVAGTGADMFRAVSTSGPSGNLAARTLDIPYEVLAPFLDHDAFKVLNVYKRSIEPQLALKEIFGHTNFDDFRTNVMLVERDRIKSGYIELARTATGDDLERISSELNKFDELWSEGEGLVKQLFDGMLGKTRMSENAHTALATTGRVTRKLMTPIYLSGQVISSLVDIPRQIGTHGITPVMSAWGNYLTSKAFRSMSKETAERIGVALELTSFKLKTHGEEAFGLYEREVVGAARGRIESRVDQMAEGFQWLNGAMVWNDSLRGVTATLAEDRLLRAASKGWGNLNKSDREWMLVLGIDEKQLGGIATAARGNTQKTRRFMHTDIEDWTDLEAARAFKLAVLKDAQTTALTPFQGVMPTWYDTEAGRFLWQFKSFMSASYQQTLMVGLQRNDARVWTGLAAMVATGMAVSELKDITSGRPVKEKTLAERVAQGVDRSGAFDMPLALAGYANAIASDMGVSPSQIFADNNRRPRGVLDSLLGPTGSTAEKAARASREIVENGVTEKAQQDLASITPYNKFLGFNWSKALIDSIHGHTQYIDRVTDAFKNTFPGMYPDE